MPQPAARLVQSRLALGIRILLFRPLWAGGLGGPMSTKQGQTLCGKPFVLMALSGNASGNASAPSSDISIRVPGRRPVPIAIISAMLRIRCPHSALFLSLRSKWTLFLPGWYLQPVEDLVRPVDGFRHNWVEYRHDVVSLLLQHYFLHSLFCSIIRRFTYFQRATGERYPPLAVSDREHIPFICSTQCNCVLIFWKPESMGFSEKRNSGHPNPARDPSGTD